MQLQVCGAAREVTGSCYLIEATRCQFLVDCGLHQGGAAEDARNREPFPFDPADIDFVLLTHAHIDHSGLLPRLVSEGFGGPIYATTATVDLAEIMLLDSAHIQEMEAEWRQRKSRRAGRRAGGPLYTQEDAQETARLFQGIRYDEVTEPAPGVRVCFRDAGHILGSAVLEMWLRGEGGEAKLVFSGDVGQPGQPIIRDPESVSSADYLVMESTYGDRVHDGGGDAKTQLAEIIEQAHESGGNVIIPAFAVGRTQELIYFLKEICEERGLDTQTYVDSPLAVQATEVFRRHRESFDEDAMELIANNGPIFNFPQLHYTQSADESRALNDRRGIVIISASGMAEAGRIKHHLKHNLWRPEAHVVIVGYQAHGTLGRRLLEGEKRVRIFGEEIRVRATIHEITGLSAHADREQLLAWASHLERPRLVLLTHGEPQAAFSLQKLLEEKLDFHVLVPTLLESVALAEMKPETERMPS
ncbi:MAG: MBL fold metallo-hydrolase [Thermoleophilia bacterium]|nr:MBL fold metallo-hydrolase [Thermoleophilia bacterium]